MSGKQLWVKKTVVNNNQQQQPSSPNTATTNNNTPTSNTTTPNVTSGSDQSSSTQPNNPASTSPSSTLKITSTLKHNATPFTPQNFVPLTQPQPVPTPQPVPPVLVAEKQPHPKKNHPKKQHQKANQGNNNQQNNQGNNVGNSNTNNNNNEQHYGSLLKNKTKVIIRNIPYNFTEQDFIVKCAPKSFVTEQVKQQQPPVVASATPTSEPSTPTLPEIPHFIYDPKKITWSDFHVGHKTMTQVFSSIAYLNFASVSLLHQFKNEFYEELKSKQSVALSSSVQITDDDVDESPVPTLAATNTSIWRETPMTIEYCPLQMVPKPKKKDPRDGTIFKDEHYLRFLEQLKQPKDLTLQPLSLDNSSTTSGLGLDGGESSDGSTSSKKLGTNIPLALGGVGASSSYTKKTDEPIISPLLKELLEKKNKKGANQNNDPNKPKGNNPKKSGKPQYKRKY
ncbi:predicted protein [Naegleria gruberi]|uniref:Predicted protein n=1 Tax=Naegleria gruberi TaxID=5762 RepID=D2V862_NAEGR|nr:uncharacterized protein NAEGRDRAFT_65041 [Naegleria gruberi]EFC46991.1 predicted protein [Naegleria gruberi]|eukprot:XP_002679735.1 predicted protein [Naegleria gruberi strain NEG-M]